MLPSLKHRMKLSLKLRFRSLADLVAFRRKHVLRPCTRYFVHVERDDLEQRLTFHGFTAPFGRPRVF